MKKQTKQSCILDFCEKRRQSRAYMDQLEAMLPLKSNDVQDFKKFADLVRISVFKLQAHDREANSMSILCIDCWSRKWEKGRLKVINDGAWRIKRKGRR